MGEQPNNDDDNNLIVGFAGQRVVAAAAPAPTEGSHESIGNNNRPSSARANKSLKVQSRLVVATHIEAR